MPTDYQGRRVIILGLARQGTALARYLAQTGARVVVSDTESADKLAAEGRLAALSDLPIEYALGGHPPTLLDGADLLCLSGGVPAGLPLAQEARRRGVALSNDSQIFLEACPAGATVVGITGSAGKTTTTTLVGRILTRHPGLAAGRGVREVWVGGNIGNPLIAEVHRMRAGDVVVMELSSFQLELMTLSPPVAAVLNITPNHLDRHGTMEAYITAKSRILRHQSAQDVAILGLDDPGARGLAPLAPGRVVYFSGERPVEEGAFLRDEMIVFRQAGHERIVCPIREIQLRGRHNLLNVLAACATAGAVLSLPVAGASSGDLGRPSSDAPRARGAAAAAAEAMRAGIVGFVGVEHRLEFVRERAGVKWYNDSIASAPERVIAALKSFAEPIVLLAGGRDKKLPWAEFARLVHDRVKHVVLFGEARSLILQALEAADMAPARCTLCTTLAEAVRAAAGQAESGDVVLLSPGCASFDEFRDFAERGEKFREWVRAL